MRTVTMIGTLVAAILVCVGLVTPTLAHGQTTNCQQSHFAVGGYPRTDIVPEGYQAVYTPGGIFSWERGGYDVGQSVGTANVIATVDSFVEACPGVPVYLRGHSYGAAVVHTAVATIDTREYAPLVHVELTGNPRRPGGIEDAYKGIRFAGLHFRGSLPDPVNVATFVDRCNPRDGICDLPPFLRNPVGHVGGLVGYFTGAHRYPTFPANPTTPA